MTRFSIVLPTHNGAKTLPRTLEALAHLEPVPGGAEVILVDNASTDGTWDLFPEAIGEMPVTRVKEERRGKSFALNRGIDLARGEYVLFLDDDLKPVPGWLTAFDAAVRAHPGNAVFCGQERTEFEIEAPEWLEHICAIGLAFATTDLALNSGIQEVSSSVARGGNLLIRARELSETRFDEVAFNFSDVHLGGEDTHIVRAITKNGPPPLFVPDACVFHWVAAEEMSKAWVIERRRRIGHTIERANLADNPIAPQKLGRRLLKSRIKLSRLRAKFALASLLPDKRLASETMMRIATLQGRIDHLQQIIDKST